MRAPAVLLLATVLATAPVRAAADEGFKLVVHRSNPVASLSRAEVSQLFLKKSTRWRGGQAVQPVEPTDDLVRARFCERIHRKSLKSVKAYWNGVIFSGRDVPPLERRNDEGVLEFVRANPNAIGFVSAAATPGDVKLVTLKD
jgi:ABC-type phosphate transport system substrate-binding protein